MPIELSKRANQALRRALEGRAVTPRAVASLRRFDVIVQPNCAAKTLKEINEWLASHGLAFSAWRGR